ncbi:MAG: DUF1996 domain-containing protein, partial [Fuerstiella sp.]|nr:DUF1996 domain-containing protein [Fuerstiella sp.]
MVTAGLKSAQVSWDAASSTTFRPVEGYQVQAKPANVSERKKVCRPWGCTWVEARVWKTVAETTDTTVTVANLVPGVRYIFRVQAINPGGESGSARSQASGPIGPSPSQAQLSVSCPFTGLRATIDPIIAPGKTDFMHAHDFFGNTAVSAESDPESLRVNPATNCNDTE